MLSSERMNGGVGCACLFECLYLLFVLNEDFSNLSHCFKG